MMTEIVFFHFLVTCFSVLVPLQMKSEGAVQGDYKSEVSHMFSVKLLLSRALSSQSSFRMKTLLYECE